VERPDHGKPGNALDRRQVLRGIAAAGAVVGAGGLLGACSSSSSSGQAAASPTSTVKRRGGALKVGLTGGSGSDTLDPHKGLTYLDTARAQSLYQPLLQLNTAAQSELFV
jgi:peptide/nickel transport system substrate-binding protein